MKKLFCVLALLLSFLCASTSFAQSGSASYAPLTAYQPSTSFTTALDDCLVAKATSGVWLSVVGRIDSTAPSDDYYVQIINSATVPSDGSVTFVAAPLKIQHATGTDSSFVYTFVDDGGITATNGIVICASTTEFTKTVITSNYLSATVTYK